MLFRGLYCTSSTLDSSSSWGLAGVDVPGWCWSSSTVPATEFTITPGRAEFATLLSSYVGDEGETAGWWMFRDSLASVLEYHADVTVGWGMAGYTRGFFVFLENCHLLCKYIRRDRTAPIFPRDVQTTCCRSKVKEAPRLTLGPASAFYTWTTSWLSTAFRWRFGNVFSSTRVFLRCGKDQHVSRNMGVYGKQWNHFCRPIEELHVRISTVKASNFWPRGNFRLFLPSSVFSVHESCAKNK